MKNNCIIIFICFIFINSFSQSKEIEIIANNVNETVKLSMKNNSFERKEVSLTISGEGFIKINSPIKKLVNKGETIEFAVLKPLSKNTFTYNTYFTIKSVPTDEEINPKENVVKQNNTDNTSDLSKGIVIFSKDGCGRCNKTISYLNDHNIKFTNLNTTKNPKNGELMWKKIEEISKVQNITMPVIIYNGKLTHSHKDLDVFITSLH